MYYFGKIEIPRFIINLADYLVLYVFFNTAVVKLSTTFLLCYYIFTKNILTFKAKDENLLHLSRGCLLWILMLQG